MLMLKKKKKRLSDIRNIRAKFWDVMECNDNLKENRNIRSRFFMKMVNCHQIVIYTVISYTENMFTFYTINLYPPGTLPGR